MARESPQDNSPYDADGRIDAEKLSKALRHCHDLCILQQSELAQLPSVARRVSNAVNRGQLGKALREELLDCARLLTRRKKHAIAQIIAALDDGTYDPDTEEACRVKEISGIPLPRNKIDLARYYAIRLVMQGVSNEAIATFLEVDPRTVGNYISQAKERIRLTLESRQ